MSTITGLTAARMAEIEGEVIVDGSVVGDNLILERNNGTTINAGNVRGPAGPAGPAGEGGGGGGGGAIDGSYTPSEPTDWPGIPPATIQQALDAVAARLTLIEQHNFMVLLNDGETPPDWVRTSPETVVITRPPL